MLNIGKPRRVESSRVALRRAGPKFVHSTFRSRSCAAPRWASRLGRESRSLFGRGTHNSRPHLSSPFAAPRFPSLSRSPRPPPTSSILSSSSLGSASQSRSAKTHLRMLATLLLSLQYSIVSYVIYERRRGRKAITRMMHTFLYIIV